MASFTPSAVKHEVETGWKDGRTKNPAIGRDQTRNLKLWNTWKLREGPLQRVAQQGRNGCVRSKHRPPQPLHCSIAVI